MDEWKHKNSNFFCHTPEAPHKTHFASPYPVLNIPQTENINMVKKSKKTTSKIRRKLNIFGKKWELPR